MASTRTFQDMLNEYLTYDLLKDELVKRDYLLTRVEKDNGWKGGTLVVPFKAAGASTVVFGGLASSTDISEDKYVRGTVSSYKEAWGSLVFNHADLIQHDGAVNEKSFLKILPDSVDSFMDYMKEVVSMNLLNGSHFAKTTAAATANDGKLTVDRPERFVIGQKIVVADGASTVTLYVTAIDINSSVVTCSSSRGGAAYDFSGGAGANNIASGEKIYQDGAKDNSFNSLKSALLSAANGGSSTLHGQTKLNYPMLQAVNILGSDITSSNILSKIFDAYVEVRKKGRGNPNEVLLSYKHLGSVLKALESSKGAYNVEPGSMKTSVYGWTEVTIGGIKGALKVIGIQELDDAEIILMDWRAVKFHTNGFFRKRVAPDGKHYYETRSTTGYQYIVDMCVFGELVVAKPALCGIIHTISY